MTNPGHDLRTLDSPRVLAEDERAVLSQLLAAPFVGRAAVSAQLANARIVAEGHDDTRTIRFQLAPETRSLDHDIPRVPVEGELADEDGTPIYVLLHVVDRRAVELEIYRADGGKIQRSRITSLQTVTVAES